ncbi:hypothetical protein AB0I51_09355 [Streptomyces sp. NPDC050549]|uniref:hypothetical protein n=1 Tax=Streptomyces sp. NPDC050549 TaxID=3155406 RepID=UPI003422860B
MGLIHGHDICLRPRNVARALANPADLAPTARAVPPLEITLPGGDRLVLPFTSRFKSEPVDCSASGTLELDLSLMVGVDDELREYAQTTGPEPGADGRVQVGYVYATIRFESLLHPGYTSVERWAATAPPSRSASTCGDLVRLREVSIGAPSPGHNDRILVGVVSSGSPTRPLGPRSLGLRFGPVTG